MGKSSDERFQQSGESFKKAGELYGKVWKGLKEIPAALWNTLKGSFEGFLGWDKKIGEEIEQGMIEKGKDPSGRLKKFLRNNILKISLLLSVSGVITGVEIVKNGNEENEDKDNVELAINEEEKNAIKSTVVEDLQYIEQGVKLLRDGPLTFYVVQKGECLSVIKKKLQKIPEFSYLSEPEYYVPNSGRNIKGFNTPSNSLTPGFFLPIPMKATDREIEIADFKNYARDAIKQMESDEHYGKQTKELLKKVDTKDVVNIMTAFARCETACDQEQFIDPIGSAELHRREPKHKAYSFSYFHILMGKGPGITARKNLGLTEGDCYNATNACKLFLGYCFEKKPGNPTYFFKINNLESAKNVGKTYNGKRDYGNKLRANIQYCKK